jgi:hypothetical protein
VSAFNSLVMKPQYAWFHLTSHFCTFICDIVLVIIFYCSFIVILPLPFNVLHAFSDAIAFFTDWISYSCATVGVQLSENDIYSQSCALLQESLFDTCCQSAGGSSNNATVIAATIGAIWGIGLVGAFLMWRYWSNRKPMQVTNIAEGCTVLSIFLRPLSPLPHPISLKLQIIHHPISPKLLPVMLIFHRHTILPTPDLQAIAIHLPPINPSYDSVHVAKRPKTGSLVISLFT